jgi:NAD(P)-dependent dehydrogenase (short-subunit alcohol dehydrogenase family)
MNKVALITGGAKRIGRAIALHLAKNGWDLAIHYNSSKEAISELELELKAIYPNQRFASFKADLGAAEKASELVANVVERMGSIDLLINNASIFDSSLLKNSSNDLILHHTMVNYIAPFILMRDFANSTKQGLIVNLLDTRITKNKSDYLAYSLSKKALFELTKMAAFELAPAIRVNGISPGAVLPPEDKDDAYLDQLALKTPMKTPSGLLAILKSLDFILDNQDLTGQVIFCDGGEHLI